MFKDLTLPNEVDNRPQKGWWAPGWYTCECRECGKYYIGAKRSINCAPCAYGDTKKVK